MHSKAVIEDNVLTNAGGGILISAFGPYGGPAAYGPVMNTDVLRNTLAAGEGNLIFLDAGNYLWGIGIQDFPGCSVSGLMIRGNVVPAINVIYNTDGVNGISANVIEQNQAYWAADICHSGVSGTGQFTSAYVREAPHEEPDLPQICPTSSAMRRFG